MSTTPLAATASNARQRLASSLAALQQDPNLPAAILEIVSGLARAMGPLFQVERGTGEPTLLFTARGVLQDTLARMQGVDQSYPGVADATGAIAQSLGMIFAAIRDHGLVDPANPRGSAPPSAPPPPQPQPVYAPPPAAPPPAFGAPPPQTPVPLVQQAAAPVPLVHQAAAPVPLVHQTAPPVVASQPAVTAAANVAPPRHVETAHAHRDQVPSLLPDTAAKIPVGPNGLPRVEVELDVHSDSNFYTNFLGDIRDKGGIFVATFGALAINTSCEVLISFPGSLTAEVRGVVRWKREASDGGLTPGLGVEITHGAPDAWKLIDRFIKNREPIIHDV